MADQEDVVLTSVVAITAVVASRNVDRVECVSLGRLINFKVLAHPLIGVEFDKSSRLPQKSTSTPVWTLQVRDGVTGSRSGSKSTTDLHCKLCAKD